MTLFDLLQSQLTDPFRIGLIVALLYTAVQNRAVTGMALPLVAGLAFVAVILPTTMGLGSAAALGQWTVVWVGLIANAILLAVALAGWQVIQRIRK